jgi:hypothetical protein
MPRPLVKGWVAIHLCFAILTRCAALGEAELLYPTLSERGCSSNSLSFEFDVTPTKCGVDGSIAVVNVQGGVTSGLTYVWDDGSTESSVTGVQQGQYVTVQVASGGDQCQAFNEYTFPTWELVFLSIQAVDVTSYGGDDGAISVSVSATDGLSYILWSYSGITYSGVRVNGTSGDGLEAGDYQFSATAYDSNGCVALIDFHQTIQQPLPPADLQPNSTMCVFKVYKDVPTPKQTVGKRS